jgi:hypothetical protein
VAAPHGAAFFLVRHCQAIHPITHASPLPTLGQAVAGLSAYAKGVSLGIIEPRPELVRERSDRLAESKCLHVDLLGRAAPVVRTPDGLRR